MSSLCWQNSAIADLELQQSKVPSENGKSFSRPWIFAALIGVTLGLVSILCCVGIVFGTDFGFVAISPDDEISGKLLADTGLKLRDRHQKTHLLNLLAPLRLPAGDYEIDASDLPKSLRIEPTMFTLNRFETKKITVTYVTPKSNRPVLALITREDAKRLQRDWAIYLKRDVFETNSLGMKFSLIPPGEFLMGSTDEQLRQHQNELKPFEKKSLPDGYANRVSFEKPQHRVSISKPFYFCTTEVPFGQFGKFVAAGKKYLTEPEIKAGAARESRRARSQSANRNTTGERQVSFRLASNPCATSHGRTPKHFAYG